MISKNKIKEINKLQQKKFRDENNLFIAENPKVVTELLKTLDCKFIAGTKEFFSLHNIFAEEKEETSYEELKKLSLLTSPQQVFALFHKPKYNLDKNITSGQICLALDDIQDPGNMGTILRIADWFGIENIFCSSHCADVYNPKTVQATMGALARVKVFNVDLPSFLKEQKETGVPIFGTLLDGKNIYEQNLSNNGIIVMGNEGNGISKEVEQQITKRLFIPNFPANRPTSESLNVATATAIICSEFRRRMIE